MKFRKDINGLRAVAVLPVLFFHAEWDIFTGGFLGVDVFFVISGFLISSNILKDLDADVFSIPSFYNRRARRILPALLFTCLITMLLSLLFMLPYELKNYGQSLVASLLASNNFLLYLTSGYWSLATEFKPLYHTWSLGVEEQYYIIIPLLFTGLYRTTRNKLHAVTFTLLTILLISYYLSFHSQNIEFDFLMLSHRIWELLSGSLLAILLRVKTTQKNNILVLLGILLIFSSYSFPYMFSTNPAVYRLSPVLGTLLIISFSSDTLVMGRILSCKILFLIGSWSYSIYLLHMPILAFLRLSMEENPSAFIQIIFVLLAIPLASLSWSFIEKPFKDPTIISQKCFYSVHLILAISLLTFGLILHQSYGLQNYISKYSYGNNPQQYNDKPYHFKKDSFEQNKKKRLLIIGNSFARDFTNMIIENNIEVSHEIIYLPHLTKNLALSKNLISSTDITIVVSSSGMQQTEANPSKSQYLYDFLKKYSNGEFLLIGTKNFGRNNNFILRKSTDELIDYKVKISSTVLAANTIDKKIWGSHHIDLMAILSSDHIHVPIFTPEGKLISFDTEHLTQDGAIHLGQLLLKHSILKGLLPRS
ncbi:acyltransferase [Lentisphaera profundi]|uniref:Acyltransferase n=1 Tax=Lentisphaera profundi TaxID=1658616 RepID=A0ABY7VVA2_9BACT|nr:acyltransferase [Lentisphaera profundi]WDE96669.1 acyltransferase [Lentisphaera profundi]